MMRTLQYVAGVVLLALLAVIAYDLHRVANAMAPRQTTSAGAEVSDADFRKYHAEYDAHLKNQAAIAQHDLDVILGHGDLESTAKRKPTAKPSR